MAILIVMTLGPACMFYLYALEQFRREPKRADESRGCARRFARAVTFITDPARQTDEHVVHTAGRSQEAAAGSRRTVVMFPPEAKGPARRDVA